LGGLLVLLYLLVTLWLLVVGVLEVDKQGQQEVVLVVF
jgi:hypothetical protein